MGRAYIIIVNWNGWRDTVACLDSLLGMSHEDFSIIITDNASTDGSVQEIAKWAMGKGGSIALTVHDRAAAESGGSPISKASGSGRSVVLIEAGANLGYAGGVNVALRYVMRQADHDYVWVLNNDTIVEPQALAELIQITQSDKSIGMVGSKLLYYDRDKVIQAAGGCRLTACLGNAVVVASGRADDGEWDREAELDFVTGASLLITREGLERVGLMQEDYFLYWEDADWGVRARRQGFRLVYCPRSRVLHKEGGSSGYLSAMADYYWVRNGLRFTARFFPLCLPLVPFSYLMKYTLIRILRGQTLNFGAFARGLFDFVIGKSGKGSGK